MQRVLILGSPGSGKSVFARRLGAATGLPIIHLDQIFWRPGWSEPSKEQWLAELEEALEGEAWIMDGNYTSTISRRLEFADTVFFFDFPTWICASRVLTRVWTTKGTVRVDMAPGCPEKFDWTFLHYVLSFRRKYLPDVRKILETFKGQAIVFRQVRDPGNFLRRFDPAAGVEFVARPESKIEG